MCQKSWASASLSSRFSLTTATGCSGWRVRGDIRTVLDVGANIGLFCLAARIAFPKATVHAYEPNPALKSELAGHAEAAHFRYFLEAVGNGRGTASLDAEPDHSIFGRTWLDAEGLIPQVSLADAVSRLGGNVDLLKLDCEGAEWSLLEVREIWRHVRFVTMEYHLFDGQPHDAIATALEQVGSNCIPWCGRKALVCCSPSGVQGKASRVRCIWRDRRGHGQK